MCGDSLRSQNGYSWHASSSRSYFWRTRGVKQRKLSRAGIYHMRLLTSCRWIITVCARTTISVCFALLATLPRRKMILPFSYFSLAKDGKIATRRWSSPIYQGSHIIRFLPLETRAVHFTTIRHFLLHVFFIVFVSRGSVGNWYSPACVHKLLLSFSPFEPMSDS